MTAGGSGTERLQGGRQFDEASPVDGAFAATGAPPVAPSPPLDPFPRWAGALRRGRRRQLAPANTLPIREPVPEEAQKRAVGGNDSTYRRFLAVADVLGTGIAVALVLLVGGTGGPALGVVLAIPIVVLMGKALGLYDRDSQLIARNTLDEVPALFQLSALYTLLMTLAGEALLGASLKTPELLTLWGAMLVGVVSMRALARALATRLAAPERCLVIGDAACADRVRRKLDSRRGLNAEVVGFVPLDGAVPSHRRSGMVGSLETIEATLLEHDVHRVILAPTTSPRSDVLDTIRFVKSLGVKVSLLPRVFELVGSSVVVDDADGMILLGIPHYGLTRSSRFLKRAFDLSGAALGLVLLSPLLLLLAVAIKLDSPGPVLYKRKRIGRHGEEFVMLKFRSMVEGADDHRSDLLSLNEAGDGLFKIADDPRITRVGRFMRRASLDELPQLLNVLRGEMSLVGPRPLLPEDDRHVRGWDRKRLQIQPGMTGVWQALGSSRVPMSEMVKIDYRYGAQWTLWLDVKTLMRTVALVLARRGV